MNAVLSARLFRRTVDKHHVRAGRINAGIKRGLLTLAALLLPTGYALAGGTGTESDPYTGTSVPNPVDGGSQASPSYFVIDSSNASAFTDKTYVGKNTSYNNVNVLAGSTVNCDTAFFGSCLYSGTYFKSDNNSTVISGASTTWTCAKNIFVGYKGDNNSLTLKNGAVLSSTGYNLYIGGQVSTLPGNNNSVTVTGKDASNNPSTISVHAGINLCSYGTNCSLTIQDGGLVKCGNAANSLSSDLVIGGSSNYVQIGVGGTLAIYGGDYTSAIWSSYGSKIKVPAEEDADTPWVVAPWANAVSMAYISDSTKALYGYTTLTLAQGGSVGYPFDLTSMNGNLALTVDSATVPYYRIKESVNFGNNNVDVGRSNYGYLSITKTDSSNVVATIYGTLTIGGGMAGAVKVKHGAVLETAYLVEGTGGVLTIGSGSLVAVTNGIYMPKLFGGGTIHLNGGWFAIKGNISLADLVSDYGSSDGSIAVYNGTSYSTITTSNVQRVYYKSSINDTTSGAVSYAAGDPVYDAIETTTGVDLSGYTVICGDKVGLMADTPSAVTSANNILDDGRSGWPYYYSAASSVDFGTSTDLYVGKNYPNNNLAISNGSTVSDAIGYIGNGVNDDAAANSDSNSVTVDAATWTNNGKLLVGNYGSGNSLTIQNGGTVNAAEESIIGAGSQSKASMGSNNTLTVTGTGSKLTVSQDSNLVTASIRVGDYGSNNALKVLNGATASTGRVLIGLYDTSLNNSMTVDNATWTASDDVSIGCNGTGSALNIKNGASASITGMLYMGYHPGFASSSSTGSTVTVDNATLSVSSDFFVGYLGGTADLTIGNGATVTDYSAFVGNQTGTNGTATVTNATWNSTYRMMVGSSNGGTGMLTIGKNGVVMCGGPNSVATGVGNEFSLTTNGTLRIIDGGKLAIYGNVTTYDNFMGLCCTNGTVNVSADGVTFRTAAAANLSIRNGTSAEGLSGYSVIEYAEPGSNVDYPFDLTIGDYTSYATMDSETLPYFRAHSGVDLNYGSSDVTIGDTYRGYLELGSSLETTGALSIAKGDNSIAQLTMDDSTTATSGTLAIAAGSTSTGTLFMGNGTTLTTGAMTIAGGANSLGKLDLGSNTMLKADSLDLGSGAGSESNIQISSQGGLQVRALTTGAGTNEILVSFKGLFAVGSETLPDLGSNTEVSLEMGWLAFKGNISSADLVAKYGSSATGGQVFVINGSMNRELITTDNIERVYYNAAGETDGVDYASDDQMYKMFSPGGIDLSGYTVIRGAFGCVPNYSLSAVLYNMSTIDMGGFNWPMYFAITSDINFSQSTPTVLYDGANTSCNILTISNGAKVSSYGGYVGDGPASCGNSVTVTGSGTTWANTRTLYVGYAGKANILNIQAGATVSSATGIIGSVASSTDNVVLVTGTGSNWNAGPLTVGASGSGCLSIRDGGIVKCGNADTHGTAGLTIGSGSSLRLFDDGLLAIYGNLSPDDVYSTYGAGIQFYAGNNTYTAAASASEFTVTSYAADSTTTINGVDVAGYTVITRTSAIPASVTSTTSVIEGNTAMYTVTMDRITFVPTSVGLSLSGDLSKITSVVVSYGGADVSVTLDSTTHAATLDVPAGVLSFTVRVLTSYDYVRDNGESYTLTVGSVSGSGTIGDLKGYRLDNPYSVTSGNASLYLTLSAATGTKPYFYQIDSDLTFGGDVILANKKGRDTLTVTGEVTVSTGTGHNLTLGKIFGASGELVAENGAIVHVGGNLAVGVAGVGAVDCNPNSLVIVDGTVGTSEGGLITLLGNSAGDNYGGYFAIKGDCRSTLLTAAQFYTYDTGTETLAEASPANTLVVYFDGKANKYEDTYLHNLFGDRQDLTGYTVVCFCPLNLSAFDFGAESNYWFSDTWYGGFVYYEPDYGCNFWSTVHGWQYGYNSNTDASSCVWDYGTGSWWYTDNTLNPWFFRYTYDSDSNTWGGLWYKYVSGSSPDRVFYDWANGKNVDEADLPDPGY